MTDDSGGLAMLDEPLLMIPFPDLIPVLSVSLGAVQAGVDDPRGSPVGSCALCPSVTVWAALLHSSGSEDFPPVFVCKTSPLCGSSMIVDAGQDESFEKSNQRCLRLFLWATSSSSSN